MMKASFIFIPGAPAPRTRYAGTPTPRSATLGAAAPRDALRGPYAPLRGSRAPAPGTRYAGALRPAPHVVDDRGQLTHDARVAKISDTAPLPGDDLAAQIVVESQHAEQLGRVFQIL